MTDLLIQSAIFVKGPGKAQVVNGLFIPLPNIGQFLVRTHAVAINRYDWMALKQFCI
jgi:NADPH:quinone reductase-like Zn-dependent oxidoreductase